MAGDRVDGLRTWALGFPGGPVVKTLSSSAKGVCLIPGQGVKIPLASWPKNQNMNNRSNIVTNSIKTLNHFKL